MDQVQTIRRRAGIGLRVALWWTSSETAKDPSNTSTGTSTRAALYREHTRAGQTTTATTTPRYNMHSLLSPKSKLVFTIRDYWIGGSRWCRQDPTRLESLYRSSTNGTKQGSILDFGRIGEARLVYHFQTMQGNATRKNTTRKKRQWTLEWFSLSRWRYSSWLLDSYVCEVDTKRRRTLSSPRTTATGVAACTLYIHQQWWSQPWRPSHFLGSVG